MDICNLGMKRSQTELITVLISAFFFFLVYFITSSVRDSILLQDLFAISYVKYYINICIINIDLYHKYKC